MAIRTRLFERYVETGVMTQKEIARLTGFSEEYISMVRRGKKPITPGFIARICMGLNAPRDLLFYENNGAASSRTEAPAEVATGPPPRLPGR